MPKIKQISSKIAVVCRLEGFISVEILLKAKDCQLDGKCIN